MSDAPREKRKSTAIGLEPLPRRSLFVDDTPLTGAARRGAVDVVDKRAAAKAAMALTAAAFPTPAQATEIKRKRGRPRKASSK